MTVRRGYKYTRKSNKLGGVRGGVRGVEDEDHEYEQGIIRWRETGMTRLPEHLTVPIRERRLNRSRNEDRELVPDERIQLRIKSMNERTARAELQESKKRVEKR